jgi:putative transposase
VHNVTRYFKEGNIYFLTHVTYLRRRILVEHIDLFWEAIDSQQARCAFDLLAWVVIPDHVHLLIDPKVNNLGVLTKNLKLSFSTRLLKRLSLKGGRIWHNRYWDHVIRNEEDMNRHLDYIHFNPVKHNLVVRPRDYLYSSFRAFVARGKYDEDWGDHVATEMNSAFGE